MPSRPARFPAPTIAALLAALAAGGCQDALRRDADAELQRSLDATLAREASEATLAAPRTEVVAERSSVFESLKGRREALDALGPQATDAGIGLDVGPDLDGKAPRE
ncbi:MAG: hypothetical protein ACKORL_11435, partial [Phycisphaerales bacterium]